MPQRQLFAWGLPDIGGIRDTAVLIVEGAGDRSTAKSRNVRPWPSKFKRSDCAGASIRIRGIGFTNSIHSDMLS